MSLRDKIKSELLGSLTFFCIPCLFLASCNGQPTQTDTNPIAPTVHVLRYWETAIMLVIDNGIDDPTVYKTLKEAVVALKQQNAFEPLPMDVEHDSWGNPLLWQVELSNKGVKTIRVISTGADGISQGGKGDDVVLEIRILPFGPAKAFLTRPDMR